MSEKFLSKFFSKLEAYDFKSDRFLSGFYLAFLKENEKNDKEYGKNQILLFDFYMEYILKNKSIPPNGKEIEHKRICDEIKCAILTPFEPEKNTDVPKHDEFKIIVKEVIVDGKKIKKKFKVKVKKIDKDNKDDKDNIPILKQREKYDLEKEKQSNKVIKLNKKHALNILSDFIKQSFIIINEDPEEVTTQEDENFHIKSTDNLIQELKEILGNLPPAKKNEEFNRKNFLLDVWNNTEIKCKKFLEIDKLGKILEKIWIIDGHKLKNDVKSVSTESILDDQKAVLLPSENILSRAKNVEYTTRFRVINENALSHIIELGQPKTTALVLAGSRLLPDSGAESGIETNVSPVYYSSTYSICINKLLPVYPLENHHIVFTPNVLVFKDHTKENYDVIPPDKSQKIAIFTYTPAYTPKTTIIIDGYEMDDRLYALNTQYKYPHKVVEQITYLLNTALFFGYDTLVLDDGGIEDFLLPAYHTSLLFRQVLEKYRGKFKEIIFAICNLRTYQIYKKVFA